MNLHMTIQLALGPWARPGVRYSDDLYGARDSDDL